MVLGYLLVNCTSLADRKLTKQANAIVFKIFLPCMLFYNVYQSDIGAEIHSRIKLCIWAAGGLLILFVLLFIPRFAYDAVILCEPIIWCFMTIELVWVYLYDPFVFPKKAKN